jgi:chaperone modulatory protein CbpM
MTDFSVETLDDALYTLVELCRSSHLEEGFIVECIEHGVVEVSGSSLQEWRFTNGARLRLQKAWRLHRDLELQPAALPLVLQLLGELETLQQENRRLRLWLQHWESDIGP